MSYMNGCARKDVAPTVIPDSLVLGGETGKLAANIAANWLTGIRESNPAILDMFRDRDVLPYRDLLPWSGEFAGKHITGAYYIWQLTRSDELYRSTVDFIDEMLTFQAEDGYLGCFAKECRLTGAFSQNPAASGCTWDAWNHYHIMTGLLLWYRLTGRDDYRAALLRIADLFLATFYDGKPSLASIGSTEMNLAPYHIFVQLYELTGNEKYLNFAKKIEGDLSRDDAGDYIGTSLRGVDFYRCRKPRWESLHTILGIAEMYAATCDTAYLKSARQITESILRTDVHNTGAFSTDEQAIGNPFTNSNIETCCVVAFNALASRIAALTGEMKYLDFLELAHYNAVLGSFSTSGRWSTYNTPMDGEKCANTHSISFQCRPGSPQLNCCSVNAPRGVGQCADWMFTQTDGALCVNFYEPLDAVFGETKLRIESVYPAPGDVRLTFSGAYRPVVLRVPGWSKTARVTVNGTSRGLQPGDRVAIDPWSGEVTVILSLDFSPYYAEGGLGYAGRTSVYSGPVLYGAEACRNPALDVRALPDLAKEALDASLPAPEEDGSILWRVGGITLCDFYHLGQSGTSYRTWLTVN